MILLLGCLFIDVFSLVRLVILIVLFLLIFKDDSFSLIIDILYEVTDSI